MKAFLVTLFLLGTLCVYAQNRVATEADRVLYGDYITPGDVIIDTPNKIRDGRRDVIYYFMGKQWPGLKDGVTIWFDGDKLGSLDEIKFCNTSDPMQAWHIESATFRNIPNTRVVAAGFSCHGLKHFVLDGESIFFPGLTSWTGARKFLNGAFGFHIVNDLTKGHGYTITVRDGGTIRLNGFEVQHGFSGVRINGGDYDMTVESIEISNFYIHDTGEGEGQYLGATHKPPLAKLKNLKIHHGIIARTAAEALQVQHLVGGTDIHHVTIFGADVRWLNAFMPGQDTGIQWSVDAGVNKLHHVLVDGFGSLGLVPFGSPEVATGGLSRVSNVLFNDGVDTGIYLHKSASFGIKWEFDSLYFRGFNETYYDVTGRKDRNYLISRNNGSDTFIFRNIFHDGTKAKVFENTSGITVDFATVVERQLPAPEYVNSGFYEPARCIKQWSPYYAPFFPVSRQGATKIQAPTHWKAGEIAIEVIDDYRFYKCTRTHLADETPPSNSPNFIALTWDADGIRSDRPEWKSGTQQSYFPPDDLRLRDGNYWKKLQIGFQEKLVKTASAQAVH